MGGLIIFHLSVIVFRVLVAALHSAPSVLSTPSTFMLAYFFLTFLFNQVLVTVK